MKFTLRWLYEHLETDASLDDVVDRLNTIGLEVESVTDPSESLLAFVIGDVTDCQPHPDADKLQVCTVNTGQETVQVVCGAPNAKAGMKGVFAPPGTVVPGTGLYLKRAKIRGVESHGMLCSEREIGVSDEHEGIIELPADAPVGEPYAAYAGLDDPVIEIGITPNRQDCLGVHGIARDLAVTGLGNVKTPTPKQVSGAFKSEIGVERRLGDEGDACPLFVGRYVRGVKNGPSPKWLQDRLRAIGLRPISALVDMTNYIAFDRGRPLHVFDADTIAGGIHIRLSKPGEKLLALDGKEYDLDDSVTVIADDDGALALGGIIGGESSGCGDETTDVFIEAALFDPVRTAMSGRKLGIISDARYRFERGRRPRGGFRRHGAGNTIGARPLWRRGQRTRCRRRCAGLAAHGAVPAGPGTCADRSRRAGRRKPRDPGEAWLHAGARGRRHRCPGAVVASRHRRRSRSGGRDRADQRL